MALIFLGSKNENDFQFHIDFWDCKIIIENGFQIQGEYHGR